MGASWRGRACGREHLPTAGAKSVPDPLSDQLNRPRRKQKPVNGGLKRWIVEVPDNEDSRVFDDVELLGGTRVRKNLKLFGAVCGRPGPGGAPR